MAHGRINESINYRFIVQRSNGKGASWILMLLLECLAHVRGGYGTIWLGFVVSMGHAQKGRKGANGMQKEMDRCLFLEPNA